MREQGQRRSQARKEWPRIDSIHIKGSLSTSVHFARLLLLLSGKFHKSSCQMFPVKVIPVAFAADTCSIKFYAEWIPKPKPTWNLLKTQDQIWILLWIPSNIAYAGWTCWCSSESQRFRSTAYCRPNREYSRYLLFAWIREYLIVWILSGVSM